MWPDARTGMDEKASNVLLGQWAQLHSAIVEVLIHGWCIQAVHWGQQTRFHKGKNAKALGPAMAWGAGSNDR